MKKELVPYDYMYYDSSVQPMMPPIVNGHGAVHPMHYHNNPFNMEENFLQILGKNKFVELLFFWLSIRSGMEPI